MMRIEVQEYMRASANLFGLSYEDGALTRVEREAIVSFAQELERKFSPSRQQGDVPLAAPLSYTLCSTDPLLAHIREAILKQTREFPSSGSLGVSSRICHTLSAHLEGI
jgi:hypothetical protein